MLKPIRIQDTNHKENVIGSQNVDKNYRAGEKTPPVEQRVVTEIERSNISEIGEDSKSLLGVQSVGLPEVLLQNRHQNKINARNSVEFSLQALKAKNKHSQQRTLQTNQVHLSVDIVDGSSDVKKSMVAASIGLVAHHATVSDKTNLHSSKHSQSRRTAGN
jgi:hypothetical protein